MSYVGPSLSCYVIHGSWLTKSEESYAELGLCFSLSLLDWSIGHALNSGMLDIKYTPYHAISSTML